MKVCKKNWGLGFCLRNKIYVIDPLPQPCSSRKGSIRIRHCMLNTRYMVEALIVQI